MRRISAQDFAFLRAVLQGLSLREAVDLYLGEGTDLRVAQAELRRLRTELLATARRAHAYGDARVLQLNIAQLPTTSTQVASRQAPTLEEFREKVDPDGFYSEAELLELFEDQHPAAKVDRRASRVARLRERQRRALDVLERVMVQPPGLDDAPSAWLEPKTAARLEAVGLATLRQVFERVDRIGYGWWKRIPRVGEVAAKRVTEWFRLNAGSLGVKVGPQAWAKPGQLREAWQAMVPQARVAPLERLAVPSELDGRFGTNRVAGSQVLEASNDYEAVLAWLAARAGGNANTARVYRREAERLLLWAVFERRRPLSSLTVDDAIAFRGFLADPQPAERWVGPKSKLRMSPDWRPFEGPLSARSVQYAITVVTSLFEWLTRQRYLAVNVFAALPRELVRSAASEVDPDRLPGDANRFLTTAQWTVVRQVLKGLPDEERSLRTRFAVLLGYATGLRISELVDARVGRLKAHLLEEEGSSYLTLSVVGKGGKVRSVPFVPELEELLNEYLFARGLPAWQECQRRGQNGTRLLATLRAEGSEEASLNPKTIFRDVKGALQLAAEAVDRRGHPEDARVFTRASTHWLRHTFGRHAMAQNVKPNVVQSVLGHASLATTTLYSSAGDEEAYADVRRFTRGRL